MTLNTVASHVEDVFKVHKPKMGEIQIFVPSDKGIYYMGCAYTMFKRKRIKNEAEDDKYV